MSASMEEAIKRNLQDADRLLKTVGGSVDMQRIALQRAAGHTQLAQALMTAQSRGINL